MDELKDTSGDGLLNGSTYDCARPRGSDALPVPAPMPPPPPPPPPPLLPLPPADVENASWRCGVVCLFVCLFHSKSTIKQDVGCETRTLGDSTPDLPLRHAGPVVARCWPCFERGPGEDEVEGDLEAGEGRGG